MTALKKTVRTRRGVEPVHPEGAAGPVVARLVLVVVLVRRHGRALVVVSCACATRFLWSRDGLCVAASASGVVGDARGVATARGVPTAGRRGSSSQGGPLAHAGRSLDVDSAAGLEYARRVDSTAQARAKLMPAWCALLIGRRAGARGTRARCRRSIICIWSVVAIFEAPSAPRRPPPRRAARIDMCVGRSAPRVVLTCFYGLALYTKRAKAKHKRGS